MKYKLILILVFLTCRLNGQQIKSEDITLYNDSIELAGTLSYSKLKMPLLIFIHGSGNVDRNGNQAGVNINANYIKQLRDSINKRDIAFFSFDKRTANLKNSKQLTNTVFTDFVEDVELFISHFKDDNRFSKIVLIGHSQGSLVGMLASKKADKFISLAGISTTFDRYVSDEFAKLLPEYGEIARQQFKELKETGFVSEVNPAFIQILAKQNQAFVLSWMQFNPIEEIKRLNLPILIINGTSDLQVDIDHASQLQLANPKAQLLKIELMNHVLKTVSTKLENQESYFSENFPLSVELVKVITNFCNE